LTGVFLDPAHPTPTPSPTPTPTSTPSPTSPPAAGKWNTIFDDEFNTVNTNTWTNSVYWWNNNNGTQATFEPNNVSVTNGILSLTANQVPATSITGKSTPYTSGLLQTGGIAGVTQPGFSFTYGYVEARTKIAPGRGMWSALWMLPVSHQDNYELDVFENLGKLPTTFQAYDHNWPNGGASVSYPTGSDITASWHTYGVDWEPNSVTWYFDGKAVATYTDTTVIPNQPMYLIMNLDVGGDWAGSLDSTSPAQSAWQVDYVKVWQH
jgi:beta-glucanase (GH16 family)